MYTKKHLNIITLIGLVGVCILLLTVMPTVAARSSPRGDH